MEFFVTFHPATLAKNEQPFIIRARALAGSRKPSGGVYASQPDRTCLVGFITDGNYQIENPVGGMLNAFGFAALLDPDLTQNLNRQRMNESGGDACLAENACHSEELTGIDNRFGHLRTAGIARAQEQPHV